MTVEAEKELDRLRWQCRRGLLELDIVFQRFLENDYRGLDQKEKDAFSKLLLESDTDLLEYMNKTRQCPDPDLNQILTKII